MAQKNGLWKVAKKQAAQVSKLKTPEAKDRQIVLLCKTLVQAMKGGK